MSSYFKELNMDFRNLKLFDYYRLTKLAELKFSVAMIFLFILTNLEQKVKPYLLNQ